MEFGQAGVAQGELWVQGNGLAEVLTAQAEIIFGPLLKVVSAVQVETPDPRIGHGPSWAASSGPRPTRGGGLRLTPAKLGLGREGLPRPEGVVAGPQP